MTEWFLLEEWIHTDTEEDSRECYFEEREAMLEVIGSNTAMLDRGAWDELDWGVEEGLTTWFLMDLTSCNDLIGRVGFFFFFDRITMRMRMRLITMRRTVREMRMIVRVEILLTLKKSWVWIDPTWFEAWTMTSMKWEGVDGIPEIFPVVASNTNLSRRVPEDTLNWRRSPEMIGTVEK